LKKNAIFCRKLAKIAENCDHNIDPWPNSHLNDVSVALGAAVDDVLADEGRAVGAHLGGVEAPAASTDKEPLVTQLDPPADFALCIKALERFN
jgi:hypothetical protein